MEKSSVSSVKHFHIITTVQKVLYRGNMNLIVISASDRVKQLYHEFMDVTGGKLTSLKVVCRSKLRTVFSYLSDQLMLIQ